ncbi:hypothetical protein PDJAM_G00130850 [Pangasius djambal]|uniref:Uncharacterized protein n=1 Tax=Pangasius djambal TaxID=1691987 RepID=A0ACC5ZCE1_9TELE|nr:hypothetical protein [Pangasius djambal]
MNILLCTSVVIIFAVLPLVSCQDPVPIQFQSSPVLVAAGNNAVFTVQTITNVFSITWLAPGGGTLGQWINSQAVLNPIAQYQGRVSISATQLTISNSQLSDAGNYTVTVTPSAPTGLATNSRSVTLSVFVAVGAVSLSVPSVTIEGGNASLTCSWTSGTNTSVTWGKGSTNLPSDPRFIINAGSLIISPVNRNDAGQYSCTVSNPVSSQTATASLTVYSSQANGGTLNLQIFSTNQSGQYTCSARNSITTQTSQQQISLSVVGTCLSVGAVAGIVVACFVALVLIIVAIVLILRQRNVDERLRTVIGRQKENLNNRPTVLPAPQNGHDNPGFLGQADQPDPPMYNDNRLNRSKNQQTDGQHSNNNNDILTRNRTANTSAIQPNGHLNTDMFSNNANLNSSAHLPDRQRNSNSNGHNTGSFQQVGQQNPNILIQTGQAEPGPHTVLINLNTLPQHQNATTQPHTVQVRFSAPPPSSGQPNQNTMHYNDQQSNTIQQELLDNTRMDKIRNTAQPAHNSTLRNEQPRDHRVTNQTRSRRNTDDTYPYSDPTCTQLGRTLSIAVDDSDANTHLRQMPWDRMHGTPAYPNPQVDRYESQNSTRQNSLSDSEGEHSAPALRPRMSPVDEPMRNISRGSRRNFLRQLAHNAAQRRSRADQNVSSVSRQVTRPNMIAQPRVDHQSRTSPQHITSQRNVMDAMAIAVPRHQTVQMQTAQPIHLISQAGPDQRQTRPLNAATPKSLITQAALQQHTSQTPSPFVNQIQQTQAALQHPGTQSTSAQTHPTRQINQAGQVAPAPPPVLRLAEFKTLPREHIQKPHGVKPVQAMRRPVVMHHGHRPHNMPRHARTMVNNLHKHPANPNIHPSAHWHGNTQGHPVHVSQVHKSRHRP